MELQQMSSFTATSPSASFRALLNGNGNRVAAGFAVKRSRRLRVSSELEEQAASSKEAPGKDRGWFFNNFVATQTMDAKLAQFQTDLRSKNGYIGSWFEDSFKYTAWIEVHRVLTERKLKDVDCNQAYEALSAGKAVLLDVRQADEYSQVHAKDARSAPLFRLIEGNDTKSNLRRLGYALITDFQGTERNPEFVAAATAAVDGDKNKQVIVYCSIGGTLQTFVERKGPKAKKYNDPERLFGRQSRSLKAIYELQQAGFTDVVHMKDGLNQWLHLELPAEADA